MCGSADWLNQHPLDLPPHVPSCMPKLAKWQRPIPLHLQVLDVFKILPSRHVCICFERLRKWGGGHTVVDSAVLWQAQARRPVTSFAGVLKSRLQVQQKACQLWSSHGHLSWSPEGGWVGVPGVDSSCNRVLILNFPDCGSSNPEGPAMQCPVENHSWKLSLHPAPLGPSNSGNSQSPLLISS